VSPQERSRRAGKWRGCPGRPDALAHVDLQWPCTNRATAVAARQPTGAACPAPPGSPDSHPVCCFVGCSVGHLLQAGSPQAPLHPMVSTPPRTCPGAAPLAGLPRPACAGCRPPWGGCAPTATLAPAAGVQGAGGAHGSAPHAPPLPPPGAPPPPPPLCTCSIVAQPLCRQLTPTRPHDRPPADQPQQA